ncbi:MAG: hypothetical protein IPH97_02675 [Ignavibacteriales bacterium]|nr:hypothetical protein [Ignavibacteriales bacterium]
MLHKLLPAVLFLVSSFIYSQSNQQLIKEDAPGVFINCWFCDLNFIKEQIPIVNYVNDRNDADINILFTSEKTGSGGFERTAIFFGQKQFGGKNDTLKFSSLPNESANITRDKTVEIIKLGLVNYLSKSPISDKIIISYKIPEQVKTKEEDPWDFWVFKLSLNGNLNGEEKYNYLNLYGNVSASRVTEFTKFYTSFSSSYNESNYKYDSDDGVINYKSLSRQYNFYVHNYFAIDEHWSWGISTNLYKSTYSNIDFSGRISPEVEYNLYPYSVSNERQLRLDYKISPVYNNYNTETIFFKMDEVLFSQQLSATLSLIEQWGSTSVSISGSNYFHDMSKYSIDLYGDISWQLFRGFSLNLYGQYSKIRNQISLPKGTASLEEVLLQRRQLETGYQFWGSFGVSYSFGSIYNNIVNPRFGN